MWFQDGSPDLLGRVVHQLCFSGLLRPPSTFTGLVNSYAMTSHPPKWKTKLWNYPNAWQGRRQQVAALLFASKDFSEGIGLNVCPGLQPLVSLICQKKNQLQNLPALSLLSVAKALIYQLFLLSWGWDCFLSHPCSPLNGV